MSIVIIHFFCSQQHNQLMKTTVNLHSAIQNIASKQFCKSVSTKMIAQQHVDDETLVAKNIITFHSDDWEKEIKNFQWRNKTEFPIIKIISWTLVQNFENKVIMEVIHQNFEICLCELKDIPLFKTLYLIKQSLIGFERLYSRFGAFKVTPGMVGVSSHHKCKVWLNQNFASNDPLKTNQDEYEFLRSIYSMFECRCKKIRSNLIFFEQLQKHNTFCSALGFIENYSKENKLNIPFTYHSLKTNEPRSQKTSFGLCFKSSKTPSFLNPILTERISQDESYIHSVVEPSEILNQLSLEDVCMKKSGQTAVDVSASHSSSDSFSHTDNKKNYEMRFSNDKAQKQVEKGVTKSGVEFKDKFSIQSRFGRKTGQYYFLHPEHTISQLNSNKTSMEKNFSSLLDDESDQISPQKINSLFNQNKWQQKIASLFQCQGMKQSIHEGKQPEWKQQNDSRKLHLLGHFGKDVTQSGIDELLN